MHQYCVSTSAAKNEDSSRRGFAHLFEHLLFDGSKHVPRGEFDVYITKAGGHDNAYTTEDKTNYYEVLPSNELDLALWLESDRMLEFATSEIGLATQKQLLKKKSANAMTIPLWLDEHSDE